MTTHAQQVAAAKKTARIPRAQRGAPAPVTGTQVTDPVQGDPTGRQAAEAGLGKNALAGGEYIANTYVPPAQQLTNAPSADTTAVTNALTGNIAQSADVTNSLAMQRANAQRSTEQQSVLDRQNDIATNGLGSQQYQAEREQMQRGLNSQFATSTANLAKAQARGKVYGAAASAQQANNVSANTNAGVNNEQQLFLQGEALKRSGLQDYSNTLNTQNSALAANANAYGTGAQNAQTGQQQRAAAAATQINTNTANTTDINKFNAGENDATTAAKLGAITNTAGLINANTMNGEQIGLGKDAIAAAGGKTTSYDKAVAAAKKTASGKK